MFGAHTIFMFYHLTSDLGQLSYTPVDGTTPFRTVKLHLNCPRTRRPNSCGLPMFRCHSYKHACIGQTKARPGFNEVAVFKTVMVLTIGEHHHA